MTPQVRQLAEQLFVRLVVDGERRTWEDPDRYSMTDNEVADLAEHAAHYATIFEEKTEQRRLVEADRSRLAEAAARAGGDS